MSNCGVDVDATEAYVYDGNQIVLQFGDNDDAALAAADLTHRYLWGPAVDQLLAVEEVTSLSSPGEVSWTLGDHLNTIRDIVQYDSGTNTTSLVNHIAYDSFGNKLSETSPSDGVAFGYTGRFHDADTGLQWNGSAAGGGRWYDAKVGRWLSEDAIGFAAGDANLCRYVGNSATIYVDPSGQNPPPLQVDHHLYFHHTAWIGSAAATQYGDGLLVRSANGGRIYLALPPYGPLNSYGPRTPIQVPYSVYLGQFNQDGANEDANFADEDAELMHGPNFQLPPGNGSNPPGHTAGRGIVTQPRSTGTSRSGRFPDHNKGTSGHHHTGGPGKPRAQQPSKPFNDRLDQMDKDKLFQPGVVNNRPGQGNKK